MSGLLSGYVLSLTGWRQRLAAAAALAVGAAVRALLDMSRYSWMAGYPGVIPLRSQNCKTSLADTLDLGSGQGQKLRRIMSAMLAKLLDIAGNRDTNCHELWH